MRVSKIPAPFLALALVGLLLRLALPAARGVEPSAEGGYDFYVEMAEHLLAGEGLHRTLPYGHGDRFAIRTPLYPLALAGLSLLPGGLPAKAALLGALCGAVTILVAGLAARRLFGERAGLAAAAAVALWPHAVVHDTALQDTALYTALFALAVACALKLSRREAAGHRAGLAALLGAVGALAVLTRVALLPSVAALAVWPVPAAGSGRRGRAARLAALSLLVLALGLSPWLARNARLLGAPVLTSDTGRSLWLGNNPQTFSVYPERSIDRAEERAWAALPESTRASVRALSGDELASDAWFRAQALEWIRSHPGAALAGGLRKAWATFSPWFSPRGPLLKQLVHAACWTPAALLALASAWRHRRRWREWAPIAIAALLLAAQSAVFFGHGAYRLYLDPWVLVLASGLLAGRGADGLAA